MMFNDQTKTAPTGNRIRIGLFVATLSVACFAYTEAVYAEELQTDIPDDQERSVRVLEEVVVTARRREESAQTIPVSVTALGSDTLETFQIDDLDDLQHLAPSLTVSSGSGRPNSPVYSLRGIRPTESVYGQDPTVAIYLADMVLSPPQGSNLGMYDLESVQVLKGPQGTLFGRNTTGGAILLTPRRPGNVVAGDFMAGFGNYGHKEAEFGVDAPLADHFALRFAGRFSDSDGYQTNVAPGPFHGDERGGGETASGRISAVWDVTSTVENYTVLTWDELDLNGRTGVLQAVNPASAMALYNGGPPANLPSMFEALERARNRDVHDVESDMEETSEVEVWGIINTTKVELDDELSLKSIAGYRDMEAFEAVDLDATSIPGLLTSELTSTLEVASYELQLLGSALDAKLEWVTGLYLYREEGAQETNGSALLGVNPDPLVYQLADVKGSSYSVFGQGTYHFSDTWSLTAGLRWTYDDKEMMVVNRTENACGIFDEMGVARPLDQCFIDMEKDFDQPTGTVSVEYSPSDDMLMYVASRYGYRAGGLNLRASRPVESKPFDEETVLDVEAGIKSDWFIGNVSMRSNIAVYHQWYDDIQRTVSVQNPLGIPGAGIENAAKATVLGMEIEQEILPTDNLSLSFRYAYTDPEYDKWEERDGTDLSDTPFYFTPEHALSTGISYSYPLKTAGLLRFSANASYQDEVWINALQTSAGIEAHPPEVRHSLKQDAYWVVGANVGWEQVLGTNLDLSVYGKNLTDEEYTLGGIQLYHTVGFSTKVFAEPRTYGLQARYNF